MLGTRVVRGLLQHLADTRKRKPADVVYPPPGLYSIFGAYHQRRQSHPPAVHRPPLRAMHNLNLRPIVPWHGTGQARHATLAATS